MRVRWDPPVKKVSIILVSDDPGSRMLEHARELRTSIPHAPVEIVVAAPDVADLRDGDILAVATPDGAPLSQRLNTAVAASTGWSIIFLDDCVNPGQGDWVPELTGPLELDRVAMVSPQLMDPATHTIRHAGIVFNRNGEFEHIFAGHSEHAYGVFGGPSWCRNWSAVTGACFAIRREVFDLVAGFAATPRYPRHDIDLCLRITVEQGWRIFYNPYAQFLQLGHTRLEDWVRNERGFAREYARRCFPLGDPFFHPRLRCLDGKVLLDLGDDKTIPPIDYAAEARGLTSYFDFSPKLIGVDRGPSAADSPKLEQISWFLPEFSHPFYGGVHTILRTADYLQRAHQVQSTFVNPTPEVVFRSIIRSAFPALADRCRFIEFTGPSQVASLPPCDAAVATLWTTAYAVLQLQKARRKFYFMQDYETRFYPAGSISAMVDATYHFGFTGICNTVSLRDIYSRLDGQADYFDPSIDPSIFHAKTRAPQNRSEPLILFCYARPTHVRNSFELLSQALQIVKRRMGNDVRIVTAGAEWIPAQFGLDGVVHNLGLLPYAATGALYRACTAGVALMMTCHPSYLPFELMACGALVITNSNPYNTWLLKHRENCLLAENSPTALADALEEGLANHALREELVTNAARMVEEKYSNWDTQLERIYRILCEK